MVHYPQSSMISYKLPRFLYMNETYITLNQLKDEVERRQDQVAGETDQHSSE